MDRRKILKGSGAFLAANAFAGMGVPSLAAASGLSFHSIHEDAAKTARALRGDRDVTLTILLPSGSSANVLPAAGPFTELTGVKIAIEETPVDEINSQILVDSLSGIGTYDLALPATFGIPDLVEAGALENLDRFAAKYEPAEYQTDALYSLGDYYKGSLYGYQTDGDVYLMFYNKEMLENEDNQKRYADTHGSALAIPKTWQELDRQMAFFQRPDEGTYGGALFRTPNYIAWEFWIRFHAKGYWPFDADLRPQIGNAAGVEALTELIEASKSLYPQARTNGLFDNWAAFANGNIYCNIGWGGTQKFMNGENSKVRGKLLFGPTPGGDIDGHHMRVPYFNWGWNYTVISASNEPELAFLFALYACSPEISTLAVQEAGGFFDPFRSNHYADPQIQKTYSQSFLDAHQQSMANSIPDLYLKGQGDYFDALRQNLIQADEGKVTPERALELTTKEWELTTRRMGRSTQAEQWAFLRESYPEDVKRLLR